MDDLSAPVTVLAPAAHACFATTYAPVWGVNIEVPKGMFDEALKHSDAIQFAYQTGRLDLVTVILAIITVLLALGAFVGFWLIRGAAMRAARLELATELPKVLSANPEFIS